MSFSISHPRQRIVTWNDDNRRATRRDAPSLLKLTCTNRPAYQHFRAYNRRMSERVQQLLHEVRRAASEAEYKEPLGQRFPEAHTQGLVALQREIAEEIAYSLGKAGAKIERSIVVLNTLLTRAFELEASGQQLSPSEREHLQQVFAAERLLTERHVRDLLIQREALGFRRHEDVLQRFKIPEWR
jgi:hypothetical protein